MKGYQKENGLKKKNIVKGVKEDSWHLEGFNFKCLKNICSVNASRECHGGGRWAETTNYNHCLCNSTDAAACALDTVAGDTDTPALEISIIIYLIGETSVHKYSTYPILLHKCSKNTFWLFKKKAHLAVSGVYASKLLIHKTSKICSM